ncbi:MAG: CDP-alcohol phosphatidyltransferase family protein [Bacteroidota bacterium]|nr:CDP-alcohol phosphatidyltransferase family protein [Bacteroidota bacterium]MDP4215344.1 CDP-alcohol phosphatidyltransferase family protein [Bacteroidota bacterium]MDP4244472.1 CDP-alcohol phosphatidyltransferase family protein [Bacteroidota bacterium]MDP4255325.1 CDP-alcohol phosphatidyltransferase family protein [Bacteroidota bacterium]MDP4258773.1 CDP-alcohol phosphatidyltransferase family protein [Bacteroidota bacterium]
MKQLPNLFTLLNLFFGCIAVIFVLQNGITIMYSNGGEQYLGVPENIGVASLFIGLAGAVDFLDGLVARVCKATSPMGKQLDSLADVVSFGVAPGMILYQFLRMSFASQANGLNVPIYWFLPALLIPCAAAYRLAKFNIDESQQYGFKGVPTPAAGLLVASLPLIYWYPSSAAVIPFLLNKWMLYGIILLLSALMVSNLPLMALKFRDYSLKSNAPKLLLLLLAVLAAIFMKWLAVPAIFIFYIVVSLLTAKKIDSHKS